MSGEETALRPGRKQAAGRPFRFSVFLTIFAALRLRGADAKSPKARVVNKLRV